MDETLTERSGILNSQLEGFAEGYEQQTPTSENVTHRTKIFQQQMEQLAPGYESITPEDENITHAAKIFNQQMAYFQNNPPSPSGGGTDGQFFPMNILNHILPNMTLVNSDTGEEL